MKRIFTVILIFLFTMFAFSENCINLFFTGSLGNQTRDIDSERYSFTPSSIGLVGEYLYIFDKGFCVGGNIGLYFDDSNRISPVNSIINISSSVYGTAFSFAPAVGWTYNKGKIFFFQVIGYPIIIHSSEYTSQTNTIGEWTSQREDISRSATAIKTGIAPSFEWGWKHFKLGFGGGINLILADDYYKGEMDSNLGFELSLIENITFLF